MVTEREIKEAANAIGMLVSEIERLRTALADTTDLLAGYVREYGGADSSEGLRVIETSRSLLNGEG